MNNRNTKADKKFSINGIPVCDANMEMKYNGIVSESKRARKKYRCPLKTNKKLTKEHPDGCPVNHERFFTEKQYGCTRYIDVTDDARARAPRKSDNFKKAYRMRTEVERYFSRLGKREMEQTTHYKMKSIKNQMTIAHLSLSLTAYAAAILLDNPDKQPVFILPILNCHTQDLRTEPVGH